MDARLSEIIRWIQQTTDSAAGRGVLVPVSGGSDSALCFWLCAQALPPGRAVAVYVGAPEALRCRGWFESVGPVHLISEPVGTADLETLRWAHLLSYSRSVRCWMAGSRNRTEDVLGTYSLASRLATYLPLARLWKSQVMELCDVVGVPPEVTASSRLADPACGRPLEMANIPFSMVDLFLQVKVDERPASELRQLDPTQLQYLESIYRRNRFKSDLPLRPPLAGH